MDALDVSGLEVRTLASSDNCALQYAELLAIREEITNMRQHANDTTTFNEHTSVQINLTLKAVDKENQEISQMTQNNVRDLPVDLVKSSEVEQLSERIK